MILSGHGSSRSAPLSMSIATNASTSSFRYGRSSSRIVTVDISAPWRAVGRRCGLRFIGLPQVFDTPDEPARLFAVGADAEDLRLLAQRPLIPRHHPQTMRAIHRRQMGVV